MSQKIYQGEFLRNITIGVFSAFGTPREEAEIVADHLIEANLMGHDSHGFQRIIQYTTEYREKRIIPGAPVTIEKETPTTAIVDAHLNFGQVGALRLAQVAIEKAREHGVSCVCSRNFAHSGRLGAWTTMIAQEGMFGIGTIAAPYLPHFGHFVAPWGGREGRLATNPFSWAAPTNGNPLVVDFATTATSEGKVRAAQLAGKSIPPNQALNAKGQPTTDPNDFYGPPVGVLLPFGGDVAYKTFGLAMMTTIMTGALGGEDIIHPGDQHNTMTFIAVDSRAFGGPEAFRQASTDLANYMKNTTPAEGFDEVILPGEPEYRKYEERQKTGIPVPESTWKEVCAIADEFGVSELTQCNG